MRTEYYVNPKELLNAADEALIKKTPFSMIRLGMMERLLMKQGGLWDINRFLQAGRRGSVVGIDWNAFRDHPFSLDILKRNKRWTNHDVNWRMIQGFPQQVSRLFKRKPILIIGRRAKEMGMRARELGLRVAGVFELDSPHKMAAALDYARRCPPYGLALISSDIGTAPLLIPNMVEKRKCVALDMGMALDDMLEKGF